MMEELIYCKNHPKKKAKNFCNKCKDFLCNGCALTLEHKIHINDVKNISELLKNALINNNNLSNINNYDVIEVFDYILNYNKLDGNFSVLKKIDEIFNNFINKINEFRKNIKKTFEEKYILYNGFLEKTNKYIENKQSFFSKTFLNDQKLCENINLMLEQIKFIDDDKNLNRIKFIAEYEEIINNFFLNDNEHINNITQRISIEKEIKSLVNKLEDNILNLNMTPFFNNTLSKLEELQTNIQKASANSLNELTKIIENTNSIQLEKSSPDNKFLPTKLKSEKNIIFEPPIAHDKNILGLIDHKQSEDFLSENNLEEDLIVAAKGVYGEEAHENDVEAELLGHFDSSKNVHDINININLDDIKPEDNNKSTDEDGDHLNNAVIMNESDIEKN